MRSAAVPALLVLLVGLAGCSGEGEEPGQPLPAWTFGTMTLETVPLEPWEARGVIQLQWTSEHFAVWTKGEGGMPQMAVRVGDVLYTSDSGMGWTRWDLDTYVAAEGRGFRYLAWDARTLLKDATVTVVDDGLVEAAAGFDARGTTHAAALTVHHTLGAVQSILIATPADPESPYTLTSTSAPLPFAAKPPVSFVEAGDVDGLQATASDNHAQIIGWIDEYVAALGRVPSNVDAQALALQRLEEPWPENPFDGQPVAAATASGDFAWKVCSPQDAQYQGFGLDGEILGKSYGRGCAA